MIKYINTFLFVGKRMKSANCNFLQELALLSVLLFFKCRQTRKNCQSGRAELKKDQQQTHDCKAQEYHQRWRYLHTINCLYTVYTFFCTISTANTSLQGTKINPFCNWRHVDKGPNLAQKKCKKTCQLTFWSPQNFFGPLQWESWYSISRT